MQINKKIVYLLAGVLLVAGGWFYFAGRGDVSDIRDRADTVRNELESAQQEQQDQAAALDQAESAIRDSAERAERIKDAECRDAEIIRESQSIIDRVRERGKKEN